jgi:hypothetical protein
MRSTRPAHQSSDDRFFLWGTRRPAHHECQCLFRTASIKKLEAQGKVFRRLGRTLGKIVFHFHAAIASKSRVRRAFSRHRPRPRSVVRLSKRNAPYNAARRATRSGQSPPNEPSPLVCSIGGWSWGYSCKAVNNFSRLLDQGKRTATNRRTTAAIAKA